MAGFRRFRDKHFQENLENSFYRRLATEGQTPKTLMIGCSDSRVDPALLTGAEPGELFMIRNVANLIPPCESSAGSFHGTSSAIEFAVVNLKVENVIILGHRQCGGIRALMRGATDTRESFVGKWMRIAEDARHRVLDHHGGADEETLCRHAEKESIKVSLRNLHTFPFVEEAIASRGMNVIGLYFDLEQGELWQYDSATDAFVQINL